MRVVSDVVGDPLNGRVLSTGKSDVSSCLAEQTSGFGRTWRDHSVVCDYITPTWKFRNSFSHLLAPENTPENTFSVPVNLFIQSASTSPWPFSVTDNVSDFFLREAQEGWRRYYVNTTLILHSPGIESVFRIIHYIFIPENYTASYTVHSHGLISWSSLKPWKLIQISTS